MRGSRFKRAAHLNFQRSTDVNSSCCSDLPVS
jgi:hypothetical protein